jgi:hypothetical protein
MHPVGATQSKICELGSLVLTSMAKDHGRSREERVEEIKNMLTVRPGATRGGLHRGTTGSTAPGASTGVRTHQDLLEEAPQASERSRRGIGLSGGREVKSRAGSSHGSPRRGGGRRNYLVEVEEGTEASISPKVATVEVTGAGRNRQATAAAIQIARRIDGRERGERVGAGLGRWTDPDLSRVGRLGQQAGWASRPDGPNKSWQIVSKQNFKFKCHFFF